MTGKCLVALVTHILAIDSQNLILRQLICKQLDFFNIKLRNLAIFFHQFIKKSTITTKHVFSKIFFFLTNRTEKLTKKNLRKCVPSSRTASDETILGVFRHALGLDHSQFVLGTLGKVVHIAGIAAERRETVLVLPPGAQVITLHMSEEQTSRKRFYNTKKTLRREEKTIITCF